MIVRHFLQWIRTAGAVERADAASALVRAFLHSNLSVDDRAAAEGAMLMLLDDPSPLVRRALAEALASSEDAPPVLIHALAADQPDIAAIIYESSPCLAEADLVDALGAGQVAVQAAIARRATLSRAVCAAIAEVGSAEACLLLLENAGAVLLQFALDRIVARHGHLAAIRENLLEREDLPATTRQALLTQLSDTLARFVTGRAWLDADRARSIAREARDKATVTVAATTAPGEMRLLVGRLRENGELTAGLILRALLSGNTMMFEDALAELSGLPVSRICALVYARNGAGLRAVYDRAGLPPAVYPAFHAAIEAIREQGFVGDEAGSSRLRRRMVERVLVHCEQEMPGEVEPLLVLLRKFATEAARDEARTFCDDLVAEDAISIDAEMRLVA